MKETHIATLQGPRSSWYFGCDVHGEERRERLTTFYGSHYDSGAVPGRSFVAPCRSPASRSGAAPAHARDGSCRQLVPSSSSTIGMPTTPSSTKAKPKKSPSSKKKELTSAQKPAAPSSPAAAVVAVNGPGELVRTSLPDGAECSLLSGGSLVEHDCSFSTDNKYLLCCSGNVVKVFSCKTGAQVRMLEGHTDQVTAVAHNPANILQACSASLDGCIMLWDIDGALMLRCFCLGLPIAAMAIDSTMPTDAFVLTAELPPSPTTPAYARGLAVPGRAYSVQLALDKVTLTLSLTIALALTRSPSPSP